MIELSLDVNKRKQDLEQLKMRVNDNGQPFKVLLFDNGSPVNLTNYTVTLKGTTKGGVYVNQLPKTKVNNEVVFETSKEFNRECGVYRSCYVEIDNELTIRTTHDIPYVVLQNA